MANEINTFAITRIGIGIDGFSFHPVKKQLFSRSIVHFSNVDHKSTFSNVDHKSTKQLRLSLLK